MRFTAKINIFCVFTNEIKNPLELRLGKQLRGTLQACCGLGALAREVVSVCVEIAETDHSATDGAMWHRPINYWMTVI